MKDNIINIQEELQERKICGEILVKTYIEITQEINALCHFVHAENSIKGKKQIKALKGILTEKDSKAFIKLLKMHGNSLVAVATFMEKDNGKYSGEKELHIDELFGNCKDSKHWNMPFDKSKIARNVNQYIGKQLRKTLSDET